VLADGGHSTLLDILHQTAVVLPHEAAAPQGHQATVVGVACPVVGPVGGPVGVRDEVVAVGPLPVTFIA
jgi:hypothetical protein